MDVECRLKEILEKNEHITQHPISNSSFQVVIHYLQYFLANLDPVCGYGAQRLVQRFIGNPHRLLLQFLSLLREIDQVDTPVMLRGHTLHEIQPLQVIHQSRNAGLIAKGGIAQFLLALPIRLPEMIQHAPLLDSDVQTGIVELLLQPAGDGYRRLPRYEAVELSLLKMVV